MSVEAKNKKGGKWEKSNTSLYSIAAFPGEEIKSLTLGNSSNSKPFNIVYSTGTSQATALASGYIALIRDYYNSKNITLSNTEILNKLRALHSTTEDHPDYLSPFQ
ncbi:S8 family serine peptidase [Peribacillus frigoritolerans]|uniref:S8 family serine peptidase n=1 Tax=Peribacillus frigoritolerans TaxID=450367 RepID=UPI002E1D39E3|nr:S8 family serine peptidase [Peribacillus frigoritolerans]